MVLALVAFLVMGPAKLVQKKASEFTEPKKLPEPVPVKKSAAPEAPTLLPEKDSPLIQSSKNPPRKLRSKAIGTPSGKQ
jgi:hypothetical protein